MLLHLSTYSSYNWKLYLLIPFSHFPYPYPQHPASGNHLSVLCNYVDHFSLILFMPPGDSMSMIRQENTEGICLGALESKVKLSLYGAIIPGSGSLPTLGEPRASTDPHVNFVQDKEAVRLGEQSKG